MRRNTILLIGSMALSIQALALIWVLSRPSSAEPPLRRCAQAQVVMLAAKQCTMMQEAGMDACKFTMADLLQLASASADAQNYCPALQPGQEAANE